MDPRRSPYAPGAGTKPSILAGREDVLERFEVTLSRLEAGRADVAPLITGPRGSGKTVLLNQLVANAKQRGWFAVSDEVIPDSPLSALIALQAHEVLLEMSKRHRIAAHVRRVLGVLKAFTAVSALGVTLNIDVDAVTGTADTGIFSRDLRYLFIEIGELAREQAVGVIFALDEVHALAPGELSDLNSALHQVAQRQLPVAFIGAGLFPSWQNGPDGPDMLVPSSYPARMVTYLRLEPLAASDSQRALVEPASAENVRYTEDALREAVSFCKGNAWVLQLLGDASWRAAEASPIDAAAVRAAMSQIRQQLGEWFFPRLLRNRSREEIRILTVIAEHVDLGSGLAEFSSIADLDRNVNVDTIIRIVRMLTRQDLIVLDFAPFHPERGLAVSFSMPLLDEYLRTTDLGFVRA
jgi:AAA ATPase domain